jgi:hypothetical protein
MVNDTRPSRAVGDVGEKVLRLAARHRNVHLGAKGCVAGSSSSSFTGAGLRACLGAYLGCGALVEPARPEREAAEAEHKNSGRRTHE